MSSPVAAMTTSQLCQAGLLQGGQLAGVGVHPLGLLDGLGLDLGELALDEHHLVPVLDQLLGDGAADGAGPGDGDPHRLSPPAAARAAARP